MNKILCLGRSYTASHLIDILDDFLVLSTKREKSNQDKKIILWDDLEQIEEDISHILISIPPVDDKDIVYDKFHQQIINLKNLRWLAYLSTTSVYGDHNGEWIDENSSTNPTNKRSKIRLNIENQWLDLYKKYNIPVVIFRLSGIYGPNRNQIEKIISGVELQNIYANDKYFSRIHVFDIAQILKASIKNTKAGEIYNLADDHPSPSYEVTEYAYKLLGKQIPRRVDLSDANISPMMREFYADNKKVSNKRIKKLLGKELIFPSYKEGLTDIANNFNNRT